MESGIVLSEVGRHVAPVPMLATTIAAGPLARFANDAQRDRVLPGVIAGDVILTAGLEEAIGGNPLQPHTTAVRDGDDWVLTGEKVAVPWGQVAE